MTPAERIASDTWRRLGQAVSLGARLGEETLTDLLVLDMLPHQRTNGFRIDHPTTTQEFVCGADLLLLIRYPDGSGRRIALQAKKLYPSGRYAGLDYKDASGTRQIDKLDWFARCWGAVPVYMLYNHVDPLPAYTPHWQCCRAYDPAQLGCTLVPTWLIRDAIRFRGHRTFAAIHAHEPFRPWRCVFDCQRPKDQVDELSLLKPELKSVEGKAVFHRQSPDWLRTDSEGFGLLFEVEGAISTTALESLLRRDVQAPDERADEVETTYPRRVLAVDVGDPSAEPERERRRSR